MNRRDFLRNGLAAIAGLAVYPLWAGTGEASARPKHPGQMEQEKREAAEEAERKARRERLLGKKKRNEEWVVPRVRIVETNLRFRPMETRSRTDAIVIHHIGGSNQDVSAATVHSWHLANGWCGIGYHYLIRKDGTVERGRPRNAVGAHCYQENNHTVGVNIVGNFENAWPTNAQMRSAALLLADLCRLYRIRPNDRTLVGHRDLSSTLCPGQNLYDMLPDLRRETMKLM